MCNNKSIWTTRKAEFIIKRRNKILEHKIQTLLHHYEDERVAGRLNEMSVSAGCWLSIYSASDFLFTRKWIACELKPQSLLLPGFITTLTIRHGGFRNQISGDLWHNCFSIKLILLGFQLRDVKQQQKYKVIKRLNYKYTWAIVMPRKSPINLRRTLIIQ